MQRGKNTIKAFRKSKYSPLRFFFNFRELTIVYDIYLFLPPQLEPKNWLKLNDCTDNECGKAKPATTNAIIIIFIHFVFIFRKLYIHHPV